MPKRMHLFFEVFKWRFLVVVVYGLGIRKHPQANRKVFRKLWLYPYCVFLWNSVSLEDPQASGSHPQGFPQDKLHQRDPNKRKRSQRVFQMHTHNEFWHTVSESICCMHFWNASLECNFGMHLWNAFLECISGMQFRSLIVECICWMHFWNASLECNFGIHFWNATLECEFECRFGMQMWNGIRNAMLERKFGM